MDREKKSIVLLSDGTGNSSASFHKTNVWRTYKALDIREGSNQIAYYDNGVGTSPFKPAAVLGLAFGWGLAGNVRDMYGFLCRTYHKNDDIYGFGFSRGAFTIRVTMAMIANQGIIDRTQVENDADLDRLIKAAYRRFRTENFSPSLLSFFVRPLMKRFTRFCNQISGKADYDPKFNIGHKDSEKTVEHPLIRFIGVWDTVDAYGAPIDELTRAWDRVVWPLTAKDRNCSEKIGKACHALALDEQRESFEPTLWNETHQKPAAHIDDEAVTQIWFPGVHANVGGGYPDDSLAYVPLNWILTEAEKCGLTFIAEDRARFKREATWNGPAHDSRSGLGNFYRYAPRHLDLLCNQRNRGYAERLQNMRGKESDHANEVRITKPKIHHTVFQRIKDSGAAYAPLNIPASYSIVDNTGEVISNFSQGQRQSYETAEEARARRNLQGIAWNKVWALKTLYFITFIVLLGWYFFSYFAEGQRTHFDGLFGTLFGTFGTVIRAIPEAIGKIPGLSLIGEWAQRYSNAPFSFIMFFIVFCLLAAIALKGKSRLNDQMRGIWTHVWRTGATQKQGIVSARTPGKNKLADFLDSDIGDDGYLVISKGQRLAFRARGISEIFAVVILVLFLILPVLSKLVFLTLDAFGAACDDDSTSIKTVFKANQTCFDTGYKLDKDATYLIKMKIVDIDQWHDKEIRADINGWKSREQNNLPKGTLKDPPRFLSLLAPFRRHIFADWFQPVARIDNTLFSRVALTSVPHIESDDEALSDCHKEGKDDRVTTLCAELQANRNGKLFLYLNDAVMFHPGLFGGFYKNNQGCATVQLYQKEGDNKHFTVITGFGIDEVNQERLALVQQDQENSSCAYKLPEISYSK